MMKLAPLFDRVLLKFILVGIVNTLAGAAIMFVSYNIVFERIIAEERIRYWLSSGVSYVIGSAVSFFLNKYFTFGVHGRSAAEVFRFVVTIIICYVTAYSAAKPLVYALLASFPEKTRGNISLLCGMCLFTGLNYLGQRFAVFKVKAKEGEDTNAEKNY